jgi:hypothetical protein
MRSHCAPGKDNGQWRDRMVTAVSAPFPPRIDMLPYVPPGANIDIGLCLIDSGYQPFVQTSDLFAF